MYKEAGARSKRNYGGQGRPHPNMDHGVAQQCPTRPFCAEAPCHSASFLARPPSLDPKEAEKGNRRLALGWTWSTGWLSSDLLQGALRFAPKHPVPTVDAPPLYPGKKKNRYDAGDSDVEQR